ncbi:lipopolysaccharide biosynthesis protein RfbH [Helicobacter saguini]|uniref:Lipopolysaccharide biosynthesis protein RfbH n=1 Tax=Helicobacter saguini TaxID=1548018 RepID=A0A6L7DJ44_9HELI|nr:lipopolysaccharide biosynthesis protein RfbH [Helicobacter saguini]MWV70448.1 lipopolysaccharide biosynthesis protein RfbH [Helicobacter saguini]
MDSNILRQEILAKVKEYYEITHKDSKKFIKGKSRVNYAGRVFDYNEMQNLVSSSLDFWLTAGAWADKFESSLAKFLNVKYALLVNSGSSANLLAFFALTSPLLKERAIRRGDEVITLAMGFPTTIAPIIQFGAIPTFVDINLDSMNIDVNALQSALSSKTKAIFIAHTLGNPFNLRAIKRFCEKHNLWLIEDNCDALGAKYIDFINLDSIESNLAKYRYTGTFGDIGTSSFYPAHHITMGEGGAVYTNNALLKKILLSMRDWGRDCWCKGGVDNTCGHRFTQQFGELPLGYDHKYVYSHFGFNLKVTDMQAAIGVAQMQKLESFIQSRRKNYEMLYNGLKDLPYLRFVSIEKDSIPSPFGFIITLDSNAPFSRAEIVSFLESKNIQTRNLFAGNMIKQPAFACLRKDIDYRIVGTLENTNKAMSNSFWLGVYPGLDSSAVSYIIESIKEFVASNTYGGGGGVTPTPLHSYNTLQNLDSIKVLNFITYNISKVQIYSKDSITTDSIISTDSIRKAV